MATQHTPGPWVVRPGRRTHWGRLAYYVDPVNERGAQDSVCVAILREHWPIEETAANAHLIAAAPQAPHDCDVLGCPGSENKRRLESWEALLEACKAGLTVIDDGLTHPHPWSAQNHVIGNAKVARETLRTAIANATKETT